MQGADGFWAGKRVLVTGHTGFKGSWLSWWLSDLGAEVWGLALEPPTNPSLYELASVGTRVESRLGDVRDRQFVESVVAEAAPEVVLHLAAQPLVRESYRRAHETFEINVMGTVNLCEALVARPQRRAFVNVTTDKVYRNHETQAGYSERAELGGNDPYSGSKACSDLVTESYRSLLSESGTSVANARAGNVIGGGDFAADRLIPDCVRAVLADQPVLIRNPESIRPWQHVLEPLSGYLMLAKHLSEQAAGYAGAWNFGPRQSDCIPTSRLVELFLEKWGSGRFEIRSDEGPKETGVLVLDCMKASETVGWKPRWQCSEAVAKTAEWTQAYVRNKELGPVMSRQILDYTETIPNA